MEFSSEVVRRVEIPQSLPPMENLSKICGSIILKDATAGNNKVNVEGDLLWQGFFRNNHGEEECLWEGAEFFQEELPCSNLRIRESFMMEPEVTDITAVDAEGGNCILTFTVRWWEDEEELSQEEESFEEEIREIETNFHDTLEEFAKTGDEDNLVPDNDDIIDAPIEEVSPAEAEDALAASPALDNSVQTMRPQVEPNPEPTEDEEVCPFKEGNNQYAPETTRYCLRYYRAKEGDTLEDIAERFSVSLAKMRGINELDEIGSIQGRMVRVQ